MRISTSQIYDSGALGIQNGQSGLYKLQNQLSTGRRVLTPKDDPVAAAQALVATQSLEVNAQYMVNQGQAKSQLGLVDSQLTSVINTLQNVREKVVQAGNTTLSQSDRASIATELESRLGELLGIANADTGTGEYLFSGYKGNVLPFAVDGTKPLPPATTSPMGYFGDDGERLLQVSSSRQMAVSVAGSDVFMDAKNGNGSFVTATGVDVGGPGAINKGTGTIDNGSVLDQQKWSAAVNGPMAGMPIEIIFSVNATTGKTQYEIYDSVSTSPVVHVDFVPGQAISIVTADGVDFGSQVVIQGNPVAGDYFSVAPSTNQSLFQTMQSLIGILRTPIGSSPTGSPPPTYSTTQFTNELGAQLTNLDQAFENVSRVQSTIGTRMQEIDSLSSSSSDMDIQYQSALSDLQDLDYVKAISDFIKQQTNLEAAQKSFAQISGKSLFDYL